MKASSSDLQNALEFFMTGANALRIAIDVQETVADKETLERAVKDLGKQKAQLTDTITVAEKKAAELERKYSQYAELDRCTNRVNELKKMITEQEATLRELNRTVAAARDRVASMVG
jgi:chromosome segregation ATPase